ncbi:MAG: InlB B-repeat-containing protein [Oscillospiraceae bacterium]|nr:InlB B-repeat-containing protein [Oscillospiraceae bacterium]
MSTHTVTFNPTGGSINPASAVTGSDGRLISLPTPEKSGHSFNGWFTAETGGVQVTTDTVFTGNSSIYARWTVNSTPIINTYTITFHPNGGSVNPTSATTGTNGRLTSLPTPTRNGHTFAGWFNTSNATGGTQLSTSREHTSNTTYWARWTPNPLTQIFPPIDIPNGVLNVTQNGNDIHIQANFSFNDFTQGRIFENGMCYREAFLRGVIYHWTGNGRGIGDYDITVELGIVQDGAIPVTLNRTLGRSFMRPFENDWWRNNPGRIVMNIGYSSIYSLEDFMWVSAHEFGHILGIGDMYGDYSILNILSIMNDNFSVSVQPRDIKMALIAWERNEWQTWNRHSLQPWNQ